MDQEFGKLPGTDLPRLLDMGQVGAHVLGTLRAPYGLVILELRQ